VKEGSGERRIGQSGTRAQWKKKEEWEVGQKQRLEDDNDPFKDDGYVTRAEESVAV
jgi:hypothetical protein